jgi:phosphatidylinositol alpha-1,6-mannosyltransferase
MKKNSNHCLIVITGAFHTDGGIAAVNRLMIKAIADKGYSIDIISLFEKNSALGSDYIPAEAVTHFQGFEGNKYLFTLAVWRAVLQYSYAYIFVDHINIASILFPFTWLRSTSYIVWLCGIEVFPPRPDLQGKLGLHGARKCLAISEFTYQSVTSRFPKLSVEVCDLSLDPVRHNVDESQEQKFDRSISLRAMDGSQSYLGSRVILHVGRMVSGDRYKGQDSLIRAIPLIYDQFPDVQLVLAGQGDDMLRLKSMVKDLPTTLQARIFFPGYVPDDLLRRIYQGCYVFAMPSIGEGFGLVYLEAMVHAKACLGGNVDATPYMVRDGVTGLLVDDPRSHEQVASGLTWFLSHPNETQEMGQKAAELVRSYYLYPHFQQRFWKAVLQA